MAPDYAPRGDAVVVAALPGVADPAAEPGVRAQLRRWWGPTVDGWRHLVDEGFLTRAEGVYWRTGGAV